MFNVGLSNFTATAHVYVLRNELVFLRVDYWISMDWNQYFITFAMNTDAVIEVLELIARRELDIYVLTNT